MANPITPSRLNQRMKEIIDSVTNSKRFQIVGEISNMKAHNNGNLYFTLKDTGAQVDCIMWSNNKAMLNFRPIDGMQVNMNVSVFFNMKMGRYSLNVYSIEEEGVGDLNRQFLILKEKLEKEGLFDARFKKPIPQFPKTIAVITSPTGAAVLDIIATIKRRYPIAKIIVLSTLVQGSKAKDSVVENINYVNDNNLADTIICGRGGGSIEDLWAFNEEIVARAIYNSKIPIISSVGHETDTTIADFVADVRAATPTAAAEIATCDINELNNNIINFENYTRKVLIDKLESNKHRLQLLSENQYFLNPILAKKMQFDNTNITFDNQLIRLNGQIQVYKEKLNFEDYAKKHLVNKLSHDKNRLKMLTDNQAFINPVLAKRMHFDNANNAFKNQIIEINGEIKLYSQNIISSQEKAKHEITKIIEKNNNDVKLLHAKLDLLNPLTTLSRGYSITSHNNKAVTNINDVNLGDEIVTKLSNGKITSIIKEMENDG